jgi:hypothetical protein
MLLSLETGQDIDRLKWEATVLTKDQKFPHAAAQKLKEILLDDQIQAEEFSSEFTKILTSTENLSWKTLVYLGDIKAKFIDQLAKISWLQIGFVVLLFIIFYFLNKKFKFKKPLNFISNFSANLLERLFALLGYFVPLVIVYSNYVTQLLPHYKYLNLIVPNFMRVAMSIYMQYPMYINFGYFFGVIFLCLRLKLPKPRFVRFHIVRGIMLLAFQGIPDIIFGSLKSAESLSNAQQTNTALLIFVINLFWILPCLFQAVTYTYPKSSFIRDAIEIHVGRDNDENFKWWDR